MKYERIVSDCGSYFHNCTFKGRNSRSTPPKTVKMTKGGGLHLQMRLNGYAVIPMEEYAELKKSCGEDIGFDDEQRQKITETDLLVQEEITRLGL